MKSPASDRARLRTRIAPGGVPEALRSNLFTPFASGSSDGNGFGLALSRKLVEAHNGEIFYEDAPEKGALFVIEVPQNENSGS